MNDKTHHRGFFFIEEQAMRELKNRFDEPRQYRKAVLAYLTLVRVANLEGAPSFSRRIASLADDMGYQYEEAAEALQLVKQAGLCDIETRTIAGTKEKAPSLYTVKRVLPEIPATLSDIPATLSGEQLTLPETSGESENRRVSNNSTKNLTKNSSKREAPSLLELQSFLESLPSPNPKLDAECLHLQWRENGFTNKGRPIRDWKLTLARWSKQYFLPSQKINSNSQKSVPSRIYVPVADEWGTK